MIRAAFKQTSLFQQLFFRVDIFANLDVIKTKSKNEQKKFQSKFIRVELEAQFQNEILAFKEFNDIISNIMKNETNEFFEIFRIMSNAQKMLHERNLITFNIANKF